ncbi:hypothetical protein NKJ40_00180 [Mesorhizobium sp. M0119]|uniref:hypothetical protein n=1 Tax=Mesorhizobium sp. M0119 TaxID=2956885 RepID=UPI00333C8948
MGGIALAATFAASAAAETRYDRKLEEAVMGIVAGKIGEIVAALPTNRRRNSSCAISCRRRPFPLTGRARRCPATATKV